MPIPSQTITILDPGLGLVEQTPNRPLIMGASSSGTANTVLSFSRKTDVVATLGQGPLPEAVCYALDVAGGPIFAMRMTASVAAANSVVTKTPVGGGTGTGTITVAGTPNDGYEAQITITGTGTLGTGRFRYSLDDGRTLAEEQVIPAGGTYVVPGPTGLTLTFVPGAGPVFFENGDLHEFDSTAAMYNTTNLGTAFTAILAQTSQFAFIVLVGIHASAATAATFFASLDTQLTSMAAVFRYVRAMMDFGSLDTSANAITSAGSVSDNRILIGYGTADVASSKPFAGWATPRRDYAHVAGGRATASLISTDLARVATGSLDGVVAISHDEFLSEILDQHRVSTFRTWLGRAGFFITNARLKSAAGSDFRYWQHGRVMDVACRTTFEQQQLFLSQGVRTNPNGTISEADALRFETPVTEALRAQLTQPDNAEGQDGHVSDLSYRIDRTNNVQTSETVISTVSIRPLGYVKFITTSIGFSLTV